MNNVLHTQHIAACFDDGSETKTLTQWEFDACIANKAKPALDRLLAEHARGEVPVLNTIADEEILQHCEEVAAAISGQFDHVVIIGIGGSSLCGQALVDSKPALFEAPQLHFLDNVDAMITAALLERLPLESTAFIVISKSGTTLETMAQLGVWLTALDKKGLGDAYVQNNFWVITGVENNPLRRVAEARKMRIMEHALVGGRYAILTEIGLLPAALRGMDIRAICAGANAMFETCCASHTEARTDAEIMPLAGAALQWMCMHRDVFGTVMMPYCDRLSSFGRWWKQIWAESLGKKGKGDTPINATGTIDQHSQLQLYLDGPNDKFFTIILEENGPQTPIETSIYDGEDFSYLKGRHLNDVMTMSAQATAETLSNHGRAVRLISIPEVNEYTLGGLAMHMMLETILTAYMLDINPYDQPVVEEGKIIARTLLGESS